MLSRRAISRTAEISLINLYTQGQIQKALNKPEIN